MGAIIKVLHGPTPTQKGIANAVLAGGASFLSALSRAADIVPLDEGDLFRMLHFKLDTARKARQRSRWFGGRLYNKYSGEDPDYLPLSGTHLRQTLKMADIEVPNFIVPSGIYLLRLDVGQRAYERYALQRPS
ncbi:hypothetical protein [Cohaesibacter celericrescens]|uniref:hypothetical protein n=1 Tax=Cohaesibacter celericrescens TaxID=2067669 RepID=UPI0011AF87F4|nr:hypothetical protein [Cohaesibacter celericrescens]